jgi:hypothetical protein
MTRHVFATCGAIAIAGLTVTAQSPQPSTAQPPATQPATSQSARASDSDKTLTVTGCVARAGSSASATSSPSAAGSSGGFILTNAQSGKAMSSPDNPASTTPPAASSGPRATASSYALKAQGAGVDLSQHLNHKVTVTGTIDSMAGSSAAASPSGPPSATDAARPAAAMPTLNVTSVTMVSSSCS